MARITLLVESRNQSAALGTHLHDAGHEVSIIPVSADAPREAASARPELVIYDCTTAHGPSEQILTSLRGMIDVPLIVLFNTANELLVVRALKMGADDCLCRPFGTSELDARIEARCRRYWDWGDTVKDDPGLYVDRMSLSAVMPDRQVKLTPTECVLLQCLVDHDGGIVTREELYQTLWGTDESQASESALSLYIHHLRRKLESDPRHPQIIMTKWGVGYYLSRRFQL